MYRLDVIDSLRKSLGPFASASLGVATTRFDQSSVRRGRCKTQMNTIVFAGRHEADPSSKNAVALLSSIRAS